MRPFTQVQTIVYRQNVDYEFLMLRRAPERGGFWQSVTGGVGEGESIIHAALRELNEELRVTADDIVHVLPDVYTFHWQQRKDMRDPLDVTEHVVAVELFPEAAPKPGFEHERILWCDYSGARVLQPFDESKKALSRLSERLDF